MIDDPGALPAAINLGIERSLRGHRFVSWLGDDDLLEPGSFEAVVDLLEKSPEASAGFGACRYIDEEDRELWVSRAGRWAPVILAWGPDLIPQPGMLIRSGAWRRVGGLDCSYELAFDLDLLLRLKRVGALVSTRTVVSSFRWHGDSLTVDDRDRNLRESERAKRAALGPIGRNVAWLWELPVRVATLLAVKRMNARALQRGT